MNKGQRESIFWMGLLIVLGVVIFFLLINSLGSGYGYARHVSCANNLKQIGLGLRMYAADHDEVYPDRLVKVRRYVADHSALFICPTSGNEAGPIETVDEWTDYVYVSGFAETNAPDTILMYCDPKNHDGNGANILFLDGHVEWFNAKKYSGGEPSFGDVIGRTRESHSDR